MPGMIRSKLFVSGADEMLAGRPVGRLHAREQLRLGLCPSVVPFSSQLEMLHGGCGGGGGGGGSGCISSAPPSPLPWHLSSRLLSVAVVFVCIMKGL